MHHTNPPTDRKPAFSGAVSCLIPVYNAAKFLPSLLEGIKNQTIPFSEVICYDDGSTDDSAQIAEAWGARVIRGQENRGISHARNQLLEAAQGDYIHFHDADDLIDTRFLELLTPHIAPNKAAFCSYKRLYPDGKSKNFKYENFAAHSDPTEFFIWNFVHLNALIYPREVALKCERFWEDLWTEEDKPWTVLMSLHGLKFHYENVPLVTWIAHANSTMATMAKGERPVLFKIASGRLMKHLSPTHQHSFGQFLTNLAWKHYYDEQFERASHMLELSHQAGVRYWNGGGSFARRLSQLIGIKATFWVRTRWGQLRARPIAS